MEAPEFYMGGFYGAGAGHFSPEKRAADQKLGEGFAVDDLLDFPTDDAMINDGFFDSVAANSTDSSTVTVVDSCHSSGSGSDPQFSGNFASRGFVDCQFSGDLCVPYDDLAELEWLSNFVEDSFSTEDVQNLHLISGTSGATAAVKALTPESSSSDTNGENTRNNGSIFSPETPLPGKARSKRSRAAPCDWSTRLLHVSSPSAAQALKAPPKKRENPSAEAVVRKCLHCAAEKTPQWRTGPMGPKTLCNACGVRYKSGRLVPEYRPAASPTFMSTKHSNSHRKVLELRRQKDLARQQHQQLLSQTSIFGLSNVADDYLIHHQSGPNYTHLI